MIITMPAHDLGAEQATIGCQLLRGETVPVVRSIIGTAAAHYAQRHQIIQKAIFKLHDDGIAVDTLTVADRLATEGVLDDVGGVPVILELLESVPHTAHVVHYATIVRDRSVTRRVSELGQQLVNWSSDPTRTSDELIQATAAATENLNQLLNGENRFAITGATDFLAEFPELRRYVVQGILRLSETMNFISASKIGKSWLVLNLALCVASGTIWLRKFWTHRGRVLFIDNELPREVLASRVRRIADELGLSPDEYGDWLDIQCLRGELMDINTLSVHLSTIPAGKYDLVILDALYRFLPKGCDENSNADITALYNKIDAMMSRLGAACVCVVHASKGSQSDKAIIDVGSGAGAMSRAADVHMVMRPHEVDGAVVVDGAIRSSAPMDPFVMRFEFPTWIPADDLDPADLKPQRLRKKATSTEYDTPSKEERRKQRDSDNLEKVLSAYRTYPEGETETVLADTAGLNWKYFRPINATLVRDGRVVSVNIQKPSRKTPFPGFKLVATTTCPTLHQSDKAAYLSDTSDRVRAISPTTAPPLGGSVCRTGGSDSDEKCGLFA